MRLAAMFSTLVISGACASLAADREISDFSEIAANVDRPVVVTGYISQSHEASGLYFSLRDLDAENDRCIVPMSLERFRHRQRVTLTGTLTRTECGERLICTNTCDKFELM